MLESKGGKNIAFALKKYFKTVGVPPMIICDAAREQIQGSSLTLCNEAGCMIYQLEKGTPAANRAERYIKMTKDETKKELIESDCPMVFWDYCLEIRVKTINSVARTSPHLQGQVPETKCRDDHMISQAFANSSGMSGRSIAVRGEVSLFHQID